MDAFMNFSTSTAKSTKKRKPAQPKKKQDQTIGNGKLSPKKDKAKTVASPTKTDKVKTPLKPTSFSICESDKVKTPSNKAVFAEPNVKCPESKTTTSLSDQLATPKTVSNDFSEGDRTKAKRKKKHSLSECHDMETPSKKAETEKIDISEPNPTDIPCKKTKSKKDVKVAKHGCVETPKVAIQTSPCGLDSTELSESNRSKQSECVLHSKAKKAKSKKGKNVAPAGGDTTIQTCTEDATESLTSDQSKINQVSDFNPPETPSKKAKLKKSKKSKEPQKPGDMTKLSGECQIEVDNHHSKSHQTETLSTPVREAKSVLGSELVKKRSKKAKKSLFEPNGTETPSKKIETQAATSISEPLNSVTPCKKSKTKKGSEVNRVDSLVKKAVVDVGEGEATKSSSSKPDNTDNLLKKSKRKRADHSGENMTTSVTEHVSECDDSGVDRSLIPTGNSTESQGQESVSAGEVEGTPEPKKRKKNKKDKEKKNESDENVEEVPPTPPAPLAEEFADSLPSSQKKKSKTYF